MLRWGASNIARKCFSEGKRRNKGQISFLIRNERKESLGERGRARGW